MYNSIYPIQIKPYVPPQYQQSATSKSNEQESSQSADLKDKRSNSRSTNPYDNSNSDGKNGYRQEFPNGQKSAIDYSKSQVNIAQILTDFKNTALAIGSPPNIIQEVDRYLALAETESLKNDPDKKLIQSNLKNASTILDKFISVTLEKKSQVVENWIDALFLQQVNYKSDPTTINEDFLVKLPDKETGEMKPISQNLAPQEQIEETVETEAQGEAPSVAEQPKPKSFYVPQDPEIKNSLIQGKKYAAANEPQKAKEAFNLALERAISIGDTNAEGIAGFELGKIYDKEDNLPQALKYYNQAHRATNDNNLKAKALYSMAQIYDDVVYFEPAMEHYFAAISYAGEADNLKAQTLALSDIADMYADRYDIQNTYKYYAEAKNIAKETNDNKIMGAIWSRSGDSLAVVDENINALKDYKESSQFYAQTDIAQTNIAVKMAKNYEKAAQIMLKLGNTTKAKSLLQTAEKIALNIDDIGYASIIEQQLANI